MARLVVAGCFLAFLLLITRVAGVDCVALRDSIGRGLAGPLGIGRNDSQHVRVAAASLGCGARLSRAATQ